MKYHYELTAGIKGEYLPYIVNPDGSREYPLGREFMKNVITNIGLDYLMSFEAPGSGPGAVELDATLRWCRVGSGTNATATTDVNLQTQHTDPAPTQTHPSATGDNTSDLTGATTTGVATHQITYAFLPATASTPINEVGIGWSSVGSTLFSRFKLPSTLTLGAGQELRVIYRITFSIPQYVTGSNVGLTSGAFDATGTSPEKGWKVTGAAASLFGQIKASGAFGGNGADHVGIILLMSCNPGNFPWGQIMRCTLSSNTGGYPAVGSVVPLTSIVTHATAYTRNYVGAGSADATKYLDRVFRFSPAQPAETSSNVNAFIFHMESTSTVPVPRVAISALFDTPQTKENTHELLFGIRTSWTRL